MHLTGVDGKYRPSIRCKTIFKREMRIIMSDNKKAGRTNDKFKRDK